MKRFILLLSFLAIPSAGVWFWQHRNVFPEYQRDKYPELVFGDQDGNLEVRIPMDVRNGERVKQLHGQGTNLNHNFEVRITEANEATVTLLWTGKYKLNGYDEYELNNRITIPYDTDAVTMNIGESFSIGVRLKPYN